MQASWTLETLSEALAVPRRTLERYYASDYHPRYLRLAVAALEARLSPAQLPPQADWPALDVPPNRRPGRLPEWMPEQRDRALRFAAAALAAGLQPAAQLPPLARQQKPAPAGRRRSLGRLRRNTMAELLQRTKE